MTAKQSHTLFFGTGGNICHWYWCRSITCWPVNAKSISGLEILAPTVYRARRVMMQFSVTAIFLTMLKTQRLRSPRTNPMVQNKRLYSNHALILWSKINVYTAIKSNYHDILIRALLIHAFVKNQAMDERPLELTFVVARK